MDVLKYLFGLENDRRLKVDITSRHTAGFTSNNHYTLSFDVSKGSDVRSLLEQFNKYRGPDIQVGTLYDSYGNKLSENYTINDKQTFRLER